MWTSENERLGFQRCTRLGYALVNGAYLLLVGGGLGAMLMGAILTLKAFSKAGLPSDMRFRGLLALAALVGCMFAGWLCQRLGRELGRRRGFVYDYASDSCRWNEMPANVDATKANRSRT